jgi:lipopolysaccharide export system protein LptA
VVITQGSMMINADRAEIHQVGDTLSLIVVTGKPAYFKQQTNVAGDLTHAWGETIRYQINDEQLVITKSAKLEQQGNAMLGDRIIYLLQQDKVSVFSNTAGQRVQMIIKPKPKS